MFKFSKQGCYGYVIHDTLVFEPILLSKKSCLKVLFADLLWEKNTTKLLIFFVRKTLLNYWFVVRENHWSSRFVKQPQANKLFFSHEKRNFPKKLHSDKAIVGHPLHGYSRQPDVHWMKLSAPLWSPLPFSIARGILKKVFHLVKALLEVRGLISMYSCINGMLSLHRWIIWQILICQFVQPIFGPARAIWYWHPFSRD